MRAAPFACSACGSRYWPDPNDTLLAFVLLALLALTLAIQGGAWGPSDLELFKRAAGL